MIIGIDNLIEWIKINRLKEWIFIIKGSDAYIFKTDKDRSFETNIENTKKIFVLYDGIICDVYGYQEISFKNPTFKTQFFNKKTV